VSLLDKLTKEVTEEGKKEAVQYEKFSCFCKNQEEQKTRQLAKSERRIEDLEARIEDLAAKIESAKDTIEENDEDIEEIEGNMKKEAEARKTEHETYVENDKNKVEAITRLGSAIKSIKESEKKKAHTKSLQGFAQVLPIARRAAAMMQLSSDRKAKVEELLAEPGKPHAYESKGGDIVNTLVSLKTTFKEDKKEADEEEMEAKHTFDKAQGNRASRKKHLEMANANLAAKVSQMSEEKTKAQQANATETQRKEDDGAFKAELISSCAEKKTDWDQRSENRLKELTALATATEILKGKVASNYGANKKLNLLQTRAVVHRRDERDAVRTMLLQKAKELGSPELLVLAQEAKDPFKKIRDLIQDLVDKLEQQAVDEQEDADFCDTEMSAASADRDEAKTKLEKKKADMAKKDSAIRETVKTIADLEQEISDLTKAAKEAKALRDEEKAQNEKIVKDAEEGKTAVEGAISVLEAFYSSSSSLIQQPDKYQRRENTHAPGADAEGKTVDDRAPKAFAGDYEGKQSQGQQILGFLEVIKSDFARTVTTVGEAETAAQTDYDDEKATRDSQLSTDEGDLTTENDNLKEYKRDRFDLEDDVHEWNGKLATAKEELEKLKPQCVGTADDYKERVARREQEIEALQNALKLLTESTADTGSQTALSMVQQKRLLRK